MTSRTRMGLHGSGRNRMVINRLIIEQERVSLLPRCPRAFHAGFVGEMWPAESQLYFHCAEIGAYLLLCQVTTASTRHPMIFQGPRLSRGTKNWLR